MKKTEVKRYRINEIFYSLQGEGFNTGRAAVFIRMAGCNRDCPFCDTNHTPHTLLTSAEIVSEAASHPARFAVITGGEPLMQLDSELIDSLHAQGFTIAVETNGSLPVPKGVDWVTCSPKQKPWLLTEADELKVLFTTETEILAASKAIKAKHHFLQPLYDASTQTTNVAEAINFILRNPEWRLSLQTHRMLGIR